MQPGSMLAAMLPDDIQKKELVRKAIHQTGEKVSCEAAFSLTHRFRELINLRRES